MAGPPPPVAAVRRAVRRCLRELRDELPSGSPPESDEPPLVLVAASGGPDSTALAAGCAFEAPRAGFRAGLLTVDHGWSAGSAGRAAATAELGRRLGLDPVEVLPAPSPRREGPARDRRRSALLAATERFGAVALLLGHSLDDQAETVLMRLARGSGSRSLAGMPAAAGPLRRPLLGLRRSTLREFCAAQGLPVWDDPSNADPAFLRGRVRSRLLPLLEEVLGPGALPALARSADLLRVDADALDAAALDALAAPEPLAVPTLAELPAAVRTRVLRAAALASGCPPTDLSAAHVNSLDRLVTDWHGQGPLSLPGHLMAVRRGGRIAFVGTENPGPGGQRSGTTTKGWRMTEVAASAPTRSEPPRLAPSAVADSEPLPTRPTKTGHPDIAEVLVTEEEISAKVIEMARLVDSDYAGRELLLVGVLKGAVMVMADLARALTLPATMEFMAVSSYGSATSSSGVVRILKDLDRAIEGKDVLVVEDIIDSGLTLSWLLRNLGSRNPASVQVLALLRKPEALKVDVEVRYVGFDIPSKFVVGYGLDYAEHYRDLPYIGILTDAAIEAGAAR